MCQRLAKQMHHMFAAEYLQKPTFADLYLLFQLHRENHKMNGMIGSFDCSYLAWKIVTKHFMDSFKMGKNRYSLIIIEARCNYNCQFWRVAFGFPGTLNNLNVLHLSHLVDSLLDDSFTGKETESTCIPYRQQIVVAAVGSRNGPFYTPFQLGLTIMEGKAAPVLDFELLTSFIHYLLLHLATSFSSKYTLQWRKTIGNFVDVS